jgi:hypothetical protein
MAHTKAPPPDSLSFWKGIGKESDGIQEKLFPNKKLEKLPRRKLIFQQRLGILPELGPLTEVS